MAGALAIYNLEVEKGTQALDVCPLRLEDFLYLLEGSQTNFLPFLVAILGSADGYGGPRGWQTPGERVGSIETVIAFGFLSIYQPGLAGGLNGTSRNSVKANVFVHPGHRRQGVGRSVLDRLMYLSSRRYSPKFGYDYVNPGGQPLYKSVLWSPRQYHRVYIEVLYKKLQEDPEKAWYDKLLTRQFRFWEVGKELDNSHRSVPDQNSYWLHKVIYQHDCNSPEEIDMSK